MRALLLATLLLSIFACGESSSGTRSIPAEGFIDESFQTNLGTGFDGPIDDIVLNPDNSMIVIGRFSHLNGISHGGIAKVSAEGVPDADFALGAGFSGGDCFKGALQFDGKIVVVGSFTSFDGAT